MNQAHEKVNPLVCPLCSGNNSCLNVPIKDIKKPCWCHDSAIEFSKELLSLVPKAIRGKTCICKTCALKHQKHHGVKIYEP
ncbi:MAG: cysteine-rich CWC family protein [Agarilytica sp.]